MSKYIGVMKLQRTLSLIATIREEANKYIVGELEKRGIRGIVPSHGSILMALYDRKTMTMREVADAIHRTQPTVTVLADKLVEHGYVKKFRDPDDTRVANLQLTRRGEEFRSVFIEISDGLNRKLHAGLTEGEAALLEELLDRVSKNWR